MKVYNDKIEICEFPVNHTIKHDDVKQVKGHSMGIMGLKVIDSNLIISVSDNEKSLNVYSLPTCDSIMDFMKTGNGPFELEYPMPITMVSFSVDKNKNRILSFPQFNAARWINVNIDSTLIEHDVVAYVEDVPVFDGNVFIGYKIGNSNFIMKADPDNNRYIREIYNNGVRNKNRHALEVLNSIEAETFSEMQKYLTYPLFSSKSDVAEIPFNANNIYMYNLVNENSISLTFCNSQDSDDDMKKRFESGLPVYKGGNSFEHFFIANKCIYDKKNEEIGLDILFISWSGQPLGKLTIEYPSLGNVDIDIKNGDLYAVDYNNDELVRIDISNFMKNINMYE